MTCHLLGLDFDDLTLQQAAAHVAARPAGAPFGYVVTPNADHLVRIAADAALRRIYQTATLRLLDSRVVGGVAGLLGLRRPTIVPGSDLTAWLLAHHVPRHERITIIGLHPRHLPALVGRYRLAPPAHHIPPMGFIRDPEAFARAVAFVRDHPARFIFLAVGSPQQELLAAALAADVGITGTGLCIGASLEFLAGARRRAPVVMQKLGLEWLFRLCCEPRRLASRYLLRSPAVIGLLLRQRLAG